jgi:DNA modification methylase
MLARERNRVMVGDILDCAALLEPGSVQAICTSPPYLGLRSYQVPPTDWPAVTYAPMPGLPPVVVPAQTVCLGAEADPLAFVGHLVLVFRALRPALRDDASCWINLGDGYATTTGHAGASDKSTLATRPTARKTAGLVGCGNWRREVPPGVAPKNLLGVPWRAAFALQADGWTLRSEIIWHKVAPMPESVTDRPTKAHEQVFLFSRSPRYFYDAESIAEDATYAGATVRLGAKSLSRGQANGMGVAASGNGAAEFVTVAGRRNKRTVWSPPPAQFPGAHFATFPPELVRPMVRAGSSDRGACGVCGAPWRRCVERAKTGRGATASLHEDGLRAKSSARSLGEKRQAYRALGLEHPPAPVTTGWAPSCAHTESVVPCLILDPFCGSGTTLAVAREEGRAWIGIDADPRAVRWTQERLARIPLGRLPGM